MTIYIKKKNWDAYVSGLLNLGKKFNNIYLKGKIEDSVKLDYVDGKLDIAFVEPVHEMVRAACYKNFVDTLL